MTSDRTTRAKRALELHELATPGPWTFEVLDHDSCACQVPEPLTIACSDGDFLDVANADFIAESRTLLPALARDVLELESSCNVLRQQRDYDYRNALDGFAGLNAEIEWLESVIAAGREMWTHERRVKGALDKSAATLNAACLRYEAEIARLQQWTDDDQALPEDDAISEAFPTRTGNNEAYAEAMRMVGAKRSKAALVALVNWLLVDRERACAERDEARRRAASFDSLRAVNDALRIDKAALERRLRDVEDRTAKVK